MPLTPDGIQDHRLSEAEFDLLPMVDARLFLSSATARFTDWSSSFSTGHPDWPKRIEVQRSLADLTVKAIAERNGQRTRMLFIGASKGTISTYFHMALLAREGLLDTVDFAILDLLREPLTATAQGAFEFSDEAAADIGLTQHLTPAQYKERLTSVEMIQGNAVSTGLPDSSFDVVTAPYLQHHMNTIDKEGACMEMQRLVRPGGILALGDLTFDYEQFCVWLNEHVVEDVPYALESFVSLEHHLSFFTNVEVQAVFQGDVYYSLVVRKN